MDPSIRSPTAFPEPLKPGDKIRFVSPASTPNREDVEGAAEILRGWGFEVDYGEHAFFKLNYLAGTDEQRLADLNAAIRDPKVRAIFASAGGKGSYRIADRMDVHAAAADPKFLVGLSDITILQMALCKRGIGGAIHGAIQGDDRDWLPQAGAASLRELLTGTPATTLASVAHENTYGLTTSGKAAGRLVGGNLDMVATAAGWALPRLDGCILLLEAVNMFLGQVDRQLTMLRKAGHLDGIAGVAVGQFTDFRPSGSLSIIDLLQEHLQLLEVPILGGLPVGHGTAALCVPLGMPAVLDADEGMLHVTPQGQEQQSAPDGT